MTEMSVPTLLVVDDDPHLLLSLGSSLESDTLQVLTASTAREGIELVRAKQPGAVILDVRLPDMSGLDAFDRIRQIDPRLPVVVITAYATTEAAIEAMKRGALDYLIKPIDLHQLRDMVTKAMELGRLRHVPTVFDDAEQTVETADRIVGKSAAMQEVYKAIGRVAPLDVTVLVLGESGTGKELVARAIYHHGRRSQGPFLTINCPAIPETLLESELFGHERGAFTGADRRRIGKFEQANNGTVLLDEIGDMPVVVQAKLLRFLQDGRFDRLGGHETIQSNVRVVASTNRNLEALVASGRFRQDLYYRLKVYTIHLPSLRDRKEDIPNLVAHFIQRYNCDLNKQVQHASPEATRLLIAHDWPGNVRELQNALRFAMIHTRGAEIGPDCLPENLRGVPPGKQPPSVPTAGPLPDVERFVEELLRSGQPDIYRHVCSVVDRHVLEAVLRHVGGNQVQASELLGISRNTLRAKLQIMGETG